MKKIGRVLRLLACVVAPAVASSMLVSCQERALAPGERIRLADRTRDHAWVATVTLPKPSVAPGTTFDLPIELAARFPTLARYPERWKGVFLVLWGERIYDAEGRFRGQSNRFMSGFLTPGGLPVENTQLGPAMGSLGGPRASPIESYARFPASRDGFPGRRLRARPVLRVEIPADCPPGLYRLHLGMMVEADDGSVVDVSQAEFRSARGDPARDPLSFSLVEALRLGNPYESAAFLPPIRVGEPATPRMVVALFADTTNLGARGLLSEQDRASFALGERTRFAADLVLPPGDRRLAPCPVGYFPNAVVAEAHHGGEAVSARIADYVDFSRGRIDCLLTAPSGETRPCGSGSLAGVKDGLLATGDRKPLALNQAGRWRIDLAGWTEDRVGHRYEFGGRYGFWIADPLSFSTAAKTGSSFSPGERFPTKVQVHPPVPAYVQVRVEHFPFSSVEKKREAVFEGYANTFGYFVPPADQPPFVFDAPGEYEARILAAYWMDDGTLWVGSQTAAGIVADPASPLELHGIRNDPYNFYDPPANTIYAADPNRYWDRDEASIFEVGRFDFTDCQDVPPPYLSGDVLYDATTLDGTNNVEAVMTQTVHDPALAERFAGRRQADLKPLLAGGGDLYAPADAAASPVRGAARPARPPDEVFVAPSHPRRWNPYEFPETADLRNYYYFTAIRPGFPAFSIVTDSTTVQPYWSPSPNQFGAQFNAGPTGDLPQDVYRVDAGLVLQDAASGRATYAPYVSTIVIEPPERYARRVRAPMAEPLLTVNGRDFPLFLGVEAGAILHPGEPLALAAMVFPAVRAEVTMEMTTPSGTVHRVRGEAGKLGVFAPADGVVRLPEAGVYEIHATAQYQGHAGGVVGAPGDRYYHFAVERDRRRFVRLDLSRPPDLDPLKTVAMPIVVDPSIRDPRITWSVICPGIVMDVGREPVRGHRFEYRFSPSQFAMQFRNFQVVDYSSGRKALGKSVFFVFFVEGQDEEGRTVRDVVYAMTRGAHLFVLPSDLPRTPRSREAVRAAGAAAAIPGSADVFGLGLADPRTTRPPMNR